MDSCVSFGIQRLHCIMKLLSIANLDSKNSLKYGQGLASRSPCVSLCPKFDPSLSIHVCLHPSRIRIFSLDVSDLMALQLSRANKMDSYWHADAAQLHLFFFFLLCN